MSAETGHGRPAASFSRVTSLSGRNRLQRASKPSISATARATRPAGPPTTTTWTALPIARTWASAAMAGGVGRPARRPAQHGGRHPGAGRRMTAPATSGRRGGGTRGGGPRELDVAGAHHRELDRRDQEQPVRTVRRAPEYVRRHGPPGRAHGRHRAVPRRRGHGSGVGAGGGRPVGGVAGRRRTRLRHARRGDRRRRRGGRSRPRPLHGVARHPRAAPGHQRLLRRTVRASPCRPSGSPSPPAPRARC